MGFQRSSVSPVNSRRHYTAAGPELSSFARMESVVPAPVTEQGFFDGIDTSIRGVFRMLRKPEPAAAAALLAAIEGAVEKAQTAFTLEDPSATVPGLVEGLTATRLALSVLSGADADVRALLQIKEHQRRSALPWPWTSPRSVDRCLTYCPSARLHDDPHVDAKQDEEPHQPIK